MPVNDSVLADAEEADYGDPIGDIIPPNASPEVIRRWRNWARRRTVQLPEGIDPNAIDTADVHHDSESTQDESAESSNNELVSHER